MLSIAGVWSSCGARSLRGSNRFLSETRKSEKMRRFTVPQCGKFTVSIAQDHLDRAPESVLTLAALSAPSDCAISLKDWPDADVAVLQLGCPCGTRLCSANKLHVDEQVVL